MKPTLFLLMMLLVSSTNAMATSVREIDTEIQSLTLRLEELRKEEYNTEMQSQDSMRANWGEFAQKLTEAEKDEKEQDALQKRIAELQARKEELLKQKP